MKERFLSRSDSSSPLRSALRDCFSSDATSNQFGREYVPFVRMFVRNGNEPFYASLDKIALRVVGQWSLVKYIPDNATFIPELARDLAAITKVVEGKLCNADHEIVEASMRHLGVQILAGAKTTEARIHARRQDRARFTNQFREALHEIG